VTFSPDGEHFAASCIDPASHAAFMVVDGHKSGEFQSIAEKMVYWSPDSSVVAYLAVSGGRNFAVVGDQVFPVWSVSSLGRAPIVYSDQGRHYAFTSGDNGQRSYAVVVDGKGVLPANLSPVGDSLTFSADGAHFAFQAAAVGRNDVSTL